MKKKYCIFAIMGILLALFIMLCIHIKTPKNLDNWIGEYYYSETFPHNSGVIFYFIEYTVMIYKDGNKYYAQITGDGWHTMTRILAQVTGDRDKIEIAYLHTLPDDKLYDSGHEWFDEGEVLWRFERDGSDINTVWLEGKLFHPTLSDMEGEIIRRSFDKIADEEQEESEASAAENEQIEDAEDDVAALCETVRAIDFTVEQPHMELTEQEDRAYKEAFLRLLKNELRIEGYPGGEYYEDLWKSAPFDELLERRDRDRPAYYYDDIDGDGKPEFGVNYGCVYFFDYEPGEEVCSLYYDGQSEYFGKLLGVGKIWEIDCLHSQVERNRYIVMNSDGEWETVLELQLYEDLGPEGWEPDHYVINNVDVGKEIWEELTAPFYEAIEHEIPGKTMTEVFGELLSSLSIFLCEEDKRAVSCFC